MEIDHEVDGKLWMDLKCERLGDFCFHYGLVGHEEEFCPSQRDLNLGLKRHRSRLREAEMKHKEAIQKEKMTSKWKVSLADIVSTSMNDGVSNSNPLEMKDCLGRKWKRMDRENQTEQSSGDNIRN